MQNSESNNESGNQSKDVSIKDVKELEHKLSVTGWALFFIWIGIAFLTNIGSGVGLLGIGVITLVIQGVRKLYNLKVESFWLFVGILFILSGLWELFQANIPLVPIVLIMAGVALLVSILRKKP